MHYYRKLSLLLVAVAVGLVAIPASAQSNTGDCEEPISEQFLDINQVRAKIMNNGNLFWNGGQNVYEIPQGSGNNSIFASGIWIGGQINGQLRTAATRYGPFEFWAGPLNDDGTPPSNCEPFDRIYRISKEAIADYEESGTATPDLADWPTGLGAPTLRPAADDDIDNDGDGDVDENGEMAEIDLTDQPLPSRVDRVINLAAGERPAILGDQMTWTVMNDRGNIHEETNTPPIGLEVHLSAFAFDAPGALGATTFYSYRIFYKGDSPLTDAYMALFSDPDLGTAFDDYVGSDSTLGLGYVYNADNDDEGNYGEAPPAAGYDFFQGPLVNTNGIDDDGDGDIDEDDERLEMTSFTFFNNGGGAIGGPASGPDYYNYMQGRWLDGLPTTLGGNGRDESGTAQPTAFMFPGDPVNGEFWTELNSDGQGTAIDPADRRFVMASGPFTIQPKDEQQIVFGIVTSFGADNLDSVRQLRVDDEVAQAAFDADFFIPDRPARPDVSITENDRAVTITWEYSPNRNNYLDSYRVNDPFAPGDYVFEGYNVYQFASSADSEGQIVATYDVDNGITEIVEQIPGSELRQVTAQGSDRGVAHSHTFDGLTNYQSYDFGVQAYAVNLENPDQKVYAGSIERFSAIPTINDKVLSNEALDEFADSDADVVGSGAESNIGEGGFNAEIVNPVDVTGDTYRVDYFMVDDGSGKRANRMVANVDGPQEEITYSSVPVAAKSAVAPVLTYSITNEASGDVLLDGEQVVNVLGRPPAQKEGIIVAEGLSFDVLGPDPISTAFNTVANADGPLTTPFAAAPDFQSFPSSGETDFNQVDADGSFTGAAWFFGPTEFLTGHSYSDWNNNVLNPDVAIPFDFEMRFTEACAAGECKGAITSTSGDPILVDVPFELWNIGIGTPDETSDDVRLFPELFDLDADTTGGGVFSMTSDLGIQKTFGCCSGDSGMSSSNNDPQSDGITWVVPSDASAGEAGYAALVDELETDPAAGGETLGSLDFVFSNTSLVAWNGGDTCGDADGDDVPDEVDGDCISLPTDYDLFEFPEVGTVFRIVNAKTNQAGDSYTLSTVGLGSREKDEAEQRAAIDEIGIVPNPYKGASAYEVSQLTDEVRFTNMPDEATIRIFTLNGTLITTLEKNSPGNSFPWNLTTEEGLPIASGMYLIHVETDLGEKVLKFGVVKKRIQLNTF